MVGFDHSVLSYLNMMSMILPMNFDNNYHRAHKSPNLPIWTTPAHPKGMSVSKQFYMMIVSVK